MVKKTNYLEWYKDLLVEIHRDADALSLLCSSIPEPVETLHARFMNTDQANFVDRLNTPNPWGHPAIFRRLSERYDVPENCIVRTNGTTNAVYLLCRTLLKPGDEALVETPAYQPLQHTPELCGATVIRFHRCRDSGRLNLQAILDRLTPRTRLIILSNLHNPTGNYTPEPQILELARTVAGNYPLARILVDEVYLDFRSGENRVAARLHPQCVSAASLTKVYGLNVLECGWIFADNPLIQQIKKLQVLVEGIGSRYLESMASLVLDDLDTYGSLSREHVAVNRVILEELLGPVQARGIILGAFPESGCVYFPRIAGLADTSALAEYLQTRHRVFVVPGRFFDCPDHIRIGFGGDSGQLSLGLTALVCGIEAYLGGE